MAVCFWIGTTLAQYTVSAKTRSHVMLRISKETVTDKAATLRLEGRITGPWLLEVRRSCEELFANGRRITLDLGGVSFLDRDGLVLLQDLIGRQVMLVNCSPFLCEQLKEASR